MINNEEILELGITPNQYFLAECINNKRKDLLEKILRIDSEDKIKNDLYKLYIKGYLNCELCEAYTFDFSKMKVETLFTNSQKDKDDYSTFVKELYDIFPEEITTGSIKVKSDFRGFSSKIEKFLKEYRSIYTNEVIKKAFIVYVDRCKKNTYQYMKQIGYFVYKNNESVLAGVCEEIIKDPNMKIDSETNSNIEAI